MSGILSMHTARDWLEAPDQNHSVTGLTLFSLIYNNNLHIPFLRLSQYPRHLAVQPIQARKLDHDARSSAGRLVVFPGLRTVFVGREWATGDQRMKYLSSKSYESIWDVSCNVGFMLSSLLSKHPSAKHFGTDISNVMVESTRQNCPSCVAAQFDLGNLRHPGIAAQEVVHEAWHREDVPRSFDVILVSDVLLFIRWGGIPPVLLRCDCCCSIFRKWAVPSQKAFMENIASLAHDEVVFSYNQGNLIVVTMMQELGVKFDDQYKIWRVPGTAKQGRYLLSHQKSGLRSGLSGVA